MENFNNLLKDIKIFSYVIDKDFLVWPVCSNNNNIVSFSLTFVEKWNLKSEIKQTTSFLQTNSDYETINTNENHDKESIVSYHEIINNMQEIFMNCQGNKRIYYQDVLDIAKKVIELYKKHQRDFLTLVKIPKPLADYHVIHSINTAILTVALGLEMNLNNYKTMELCVASLVHKIGFLFIPKEISEKKEKLTNEEFDIVKKYPIISYKVISSTDFPPKVASLVLTHRENLDGSGYPQGLTGENISIEANIIGATSAYIALTLNKSYQKSINSGASLIELVKDTNKKFDKRVLKLIINVLSQYPLGSIVQLKDGSIAKVVKIINEGMITKPYLNYIIQNDALVAVEDRILVASTENTETEIRIILNKNEIEKIKTKYFLSDL